MEEYCGGGTLEQRLKRERGQRLGAEAAAVVMRQILRSVLCCHAAGMAHRDLKPDNFVFQSEDRAAALKLIDFGLTNRPASVLSASEELSADCIPKEYIHMAGTASVLLPHLVNVSC